MPYELTDYEWAAIKPMLPNIQRASIRLWLRVNESTPQSRISASKNDGINSSSVLKLVQ